MILAEAIAAELWRKSRKRGRKGTTPVRKGSAVRVVPTQSERPSVDRGRTVGSKGKLRKSGIQALCGNR